MCGVSPARGLCRAHALSVAATIGSGALRVAAATTLLRRSPQKVGHALTAAYCEACHPHRFLFRYLLRAIGLLTASTTFVLRCCHPPTRGHAFGEGSDASQSPIGQPSQ